MIEKLKHWWAVFQEVVYRRSQEVRVPVKELGLSKSTMDAGRTATWTDGSTALMFRLTFGVTLVAMVVHQVITSDTFNKMFTEGAVREALISEGAQLLYVFMFMVLLHTKPFGWKIRSNMAKFMEEARHHEPIRELLTKYKWFYFAQDGNCQPVEVVFTNVRPMYLLRASTRFPTSYQWGKPLRRDFFTWFLERIVGGLYLRVLWPYFFNPMQLAFLEYDKAAKRIGLKSGQKVLIIGAGSVPHHIRWKKRLGRNGMITALDLNSFVLKDSERIERVIELVRGIFGKRRWVSEHIPGDAAELPFEEGEFDAVIAVRCYFVSVAEALRVLKPDGKLLISTCGDIAELPERDDQRLESTFNGWIVTNAQAKGVALQPTAA